MSAKNHASPARLAKRSRASEAAPEKMQTRREGTKRRRTSTGDDAVEEHLKSPALVRSQKLASYDTTSKVSLGTGDKNATRPSDCWSLTRAIAGQFTHLDPILSADERYLFLALETSIHIYSVATSRLFRVLEIGPGASIIGYLLSPFIPEHIYIFVSSGSVSEWDWHSNKQLAHWKTSSRRTISADLICNTPMHDMEPAYNQLFSLRERKHGKRELTLTPLNAETPKSTVLLETDVKIDDFKIIGSGQAIIAYGASRMFFGTSCFTPDSKLAKYAWREVKLATTITCVDIKQDKPLGSENKKVPDFAIALGGADGSILIYHDALGFLGVKGGEDKKPAAPRRLHWHRNPIMAVRWSNDGNYVLSGGHESVMVLWQLDTGRKQFLPHLSSPICNIVVSGNGNSYVIKLADNRVVVLSARELQPLATITGLQLCARSSNPPGQIIARSPHAFRTVAAALHPQRPDQLLLTVPTSRQLTYEGTASTGAPVLQTYDIRSGSHISRQALARTNATTFNNGPDGAPVLTPDIKYLSISEDGKWMATLDSWNPYPEDVEALNIDPGVHFELGEIYLKFWRWNESSSLWQLVTRIDNPHLSANSSTNVLGITSRPNNHEFATIGSDGLLRFWRPVIRQHHSMKRDNELAPETWKCRNTLDLRGYLEAYNVDSAHLGSASVCFSEDGSVLAASLQSGPTDLSLTILIDVRSCCIKYSKVGVCSGNISATAFLGCHLLVATNRSVFMWDTVNDVVKAIDPPELQSIHDGDPRMLAVNSRTQTFATASRNVRKKATSKRVRKSRFTVQVYDMNSGTLLSRFQLAKEPVALVSNSHSAEYIVVDAGADVQRIGCASRASPLVHADNALVQYSGLGLENVFRRRPTSTIDNFSTSTITADSHTGSSERIGLPSVFGDTPPFVLPPSRIVFRDLVKALFA